MPAAELVIRPAAFADLDDLYSICLRTGAAGGDATGLYDDGDLLGHVYVGPYVLLESAFGLVIEADGALAGYALAAPDTAAFEAEAEQAWWPRLRRRYPAPDTEPAAAPPDAALVELIHHPRLARRELLAEFPAHLHIDLAPEAQGLGAGRRLMAELEAELAARGAAGVHLGVDAANANAAGFYEHLGYRRLAPGEYGTPDGHVVYVKALDA